MKRMGELASEYVGRHVSRQYGVGELVIKYAIQQVDRQWIEGVSSREERVGELVSKQGIEVLRRLVNELIEALNKKV